MTDGWTLLTIVGMTVVTVITRCFFFISEREWKLPEWAQRGLLYAPIAALTAVIAPDILMANGALAPVWRDLAALRRVLAEGAAVPVAERRMVLEPLAQPGRPYRPLAAEQLALLLVEEGKTAEAIEALRALMADQEAPSGLRARAGQMIVALGGTVDVPAAPANAG